VPEAMYSGPLAGIPGQLVKLLSPETPKLH
jgi:hypothetical protein